MAIVRQVEPKDGLKIVRAALRRRLHRWQHMGSLRGSPRIGAPLPVYQMKSESVPSRAKRVGWRYLVLGGDCPGLAHLMNSADGLKYAGITEGPFAQRLLDAALVADKAFNDGERTFEPRLLDIPSLRIHALWLYAPRGASQFVSLSERGAAAPMKFERLSAIIDRAYPL